MANNADRRKRSRALLMTLLATTCALLAVFAFSSRLECQTALRARPPARTVASRTTRPIAIAPLGSGHLAVLQADGALLDLDPATGHAAPIYRVPSGYAVIEAAAGQGVAPALGVVLHQQALSHSFLLQVGGKSAIWTWLPPRGVYAGLAVEGERRVAYVGNASTNEVYQLALDDQRAAPRYLMHVQDADRLGWFTYDPSSHAIYAVDLDARQVFRIDVVKRTSERVTRLEEAGELRALAWSPSDRRLFVADSDVQTVWAIDIAGGNRRGRRFITEPALREPSGLAMLGDTLWVADEGARMLFQASSKTGQVVRRLPWPPG